MIINMPSDSEIDIIEIPSTSTQSFSFSRPKERSLYEFIIRCCVRLEALNRTACTAILLMHRLRQKSAVLDKYCNHTLAAATVLIAAKVEEDSKVRIRDVVNAAHRILNPDGPYLEADDTMWTLRRSMGRIEFVVLRELAFDTHIEHPHQLLSVYLDMLRSWMPDDFEKYSIEEEAFAVLRDCHIVPEFILGHSSESIALAVLSVVLKGHDITVPNCRDFYTVFSKHMSEKKMRSLEEEILEDVYLFKLK